MCIRDSCVRVGSGLGDGSTTSLASVLVGFDEGFGVVGALVCSLGSGAGLVDAVLSTDTLIGSGAVADSFVTWAVTSGADSKRDAATAVIVLLRMKIPY